MTINTAEIPITIYYLAKRVMKILASVYRKKEPLVDQIEIGEEAMMTRCSW